MVCGLHLPRLLAYDDDLWTLEMEIVCPPYILDFAGARLDVAPQFPADVMAQWRTEKIEQFQGDWPTVCQILSEFRSLGIHLTDVHPGNINFGR